MLPVTQELEGCVSIHIPLWAISILHPQSSPKFHSAFPMIHFSLGVLLLKFSQLSMSNSQILIIFHSWSSHCLKEMPFLSCSAVAMSQEEDSDDIPLVVQESVLDWAHWAQGKGYMFMWKTLSDCWFGTRILWISIYWECHHPNWWTHIFQRGRYTTNQMYTYIYSYYWYIVLIFSFWTKPWLCDAFCWCLTAYLVAGWWFYFPS